MSSRFSSNSEAFTSELLRKSRKMISLVPYAYMHALTLNHIIGCYPSRSRTFFEILKHSLQDVDDKFKYYDILPIVRHNDLYNGISHPKWCLFIQISTFISYKSLYNVLCLIILFISHDKRLLTS